MSTNRAKRLRSIHPSIHPSICFASCRVCLSNQSSTPCNRSMSSSAIQTSTCLPSLRTPLTEGSPRRKSSTLPHKRSGTKPDIRTWKLPPCQVKWFVEAPPWRRKSYGASSRSSRPCVPRSPHSAAHSTQPNNPPRGAWPLGCPWWTPKTNPVKIKVGLLQTDGWTDHLRRNPTAQPQTRTR